MELDGIVLRAAGKPTPSPSAPRTYILSPRPPSRVKSQSCLDFLISSGFILKLVLLAAAFLLPAGQALAATIAVGASCTLAQAINEANEATTDVGSCAAGTDGSGAAGNDEIELSASVTLTELLPEITTHVTIRGVAGNHWFIRLNTEMVRGRLFETAAGSKLTLEHVTLDRGGGGNPGKASLELGDSATLTNVTISNSTLTAIRAGGEDAVFTFTNLYITHTFRTWSWPSAIWARSGAFTITDLGIDNMVGGSVMIRVDSGATVTLEGCKLFHRVLTDKISGDFTDNTAGTCAATPRGNGGALITFFNLVGRPRTQACGYPDYAALAAAWFLAPDDAGLIEYTLSSDCVLTETSGILVPSNVRMLIQSPPGERYTITVPNSSKLLVLAGDVTLRNVNIKTLAGDIASQFVFIVSPPGKLTIEDAVISRTSTTVGRLGMRVGDAKLTLKRVTFQNFKSDWDSIPSAVWLLGPVDATIEDSTFTGNTGGSGAISIHHKLGGTVRLLGTNTFEGNTPKDINDNNDAPGIVCRGSACFPGSAPPAPPAADEEPSGSRSHVRTCPSPPEGGRYGRIGSAQWRGHYARLGIQAQGNQAAWARGDAGVSGINYCFWDYECSTDAHWAYGAYQATEGHTHFAPGTRPPAAGDRGFDGRFNLCFSAWRNGCNSAEAWDFGFASGKQIYDSWFIWHREATSGCELD